MQIGKRHQIIFQIKIICFQTIHLIFMEVFTLKSTLFLTGKRKKKAPPYVHAYIRSTFGLLGRALIKY